MKTILTSVAAATLFAGAAFAQAVGTPPGGGMQIPPMQATPAPVEPMAPMSPMTPMPTPNAAIVAPGAGAQVALATPMFLNEMISGEALATEWIGEPIYNAAAEELGTIDDLVLDKDGHIVAAIVGVGGFLGIGQKTVAISWTSLQAEITTDDEVRLILAADRAALETAPDYLLLTEQPRDPVVR